MTHALNHFSRATATVRAYAYSLVNSNHNKTDPGAMHNSTGHQIPDSTNPLATKQSAMASSIQFWRRCLDFEDHQARRLVIVIAVILNDLVKNFAGERLNQLHCCFTAPVSVGAEQAYSAATSLGRLIVKRGQKKLAKVAVLVVTGPEALNDFLCDHI